MRWELDWLENRARLTPKKCAVIDEDTNFTWTFEELNNRAKSIASRLQARGVKKGDRIALLSPNHICYFDLLFACGKIGAILVPINWRLSPHEIDGILQDCTPHLIGIHQQSYQMLTKLINAPSSFLIGGTFYEEMATQQKAPTFPEELSESDPFVMIYTGGTTGKPKGVALSHQSILWNAINTITSWGLSADDVTINYMPMFHTGGLNALCLPILLIGGTVVIAD